MQRLFITVEPQNFKAVQKAIKESKGISEPILTVSGSEEALAKLQVMAIKAGAQSLSNK